MPAAKQFNTGDIIVSENARSEEMFILLNGSVSAYKNYRKSGESLKATINENSFFGEMSFFMNKMHSKTYVAKESCCVLPVNRMNTFKVFMEEPVAAQSLLESLTAEIAKKSRRGPRLGGVMGAFAQEEEPEAFFSYITKFYSFPINKTGESYMQTLQPRTVLLNDGDKIDSIYIVLKGSLNIFTNYKKRDQKSKGEISAGNFLSYMHFNNNIVNGTVVAADETSMLVLNTANIPQFFKYEAKSAFVVMQMLCERIELLNNPDALKPKSERTEGLFIPEQHKSYNIKIKPENTEVFEQKYYACPVCDKATKSIYIDSKKLKSIAADDDSRLYYDGVEPVYYDIIICEHCWYTALKDHFTKGSPNAYMFKQKMQPLKLSIDYKTDKSKYTINDVFFAYYFAIYCADDCFIGATKTLVLAKLWLRLSWMYSNCADREMEAYTAKKAHEYFMLTYGSSKPDDKNLQQLIITTAAVCHKIGDTQNARQLLSRAVLLPKGNESRKERAKELWKKYGLAGDAPKG